LEPGLQVQSWR